MKEMNTVMKSEVEAKKKWAAETLRKLRNNMEGHDDGPYDLIGVLPIDGGRNESYTNDNGDTVEIIVSNRARIKEGYPPFTVIYDGEKVFEGPRAQFKKRYPQLAKEVLA